MSALTENGNGGLPTRTIAVVVSAQRVDEFKRFIAWVKPTTQNPVPGDRILSLAMRVIQRDQTRQKAKRRVKRPQESQQKLQDGP